MPYDPPTLDGKIHEDAKRAIRDLSQFGNALEHRVSALDARTLALARLPALRVDLSQLTARVDAIQREVQVVIVGGTGTALVFTPGSIVFVGAGGAYAQDNANLFWDATNKRLALGGLFDLSAAAAGQIKFPVSPNASADPNTLDDYEEGSWTPVIGGNGGTSGQTYTAQVGRYVKIGKMVIVQFRAILSAKGIITGSAEIQGLPFNTEGITNLFASGNMIWERLATTWVNVIVAASDSASAFQILGAPAAATGNGTALATADINNDSAFSGAICYRTDT